jgi:hypothetical protein
LHQAPALDVKFTQVFIQHRDVVAAQATATVRK